MSLFFPVLLYNLGIITGHTDPQALQLSIQTGVLVGLYLFNYILFQVRKKHFTDRALERIGEWLLVAIAVFIVPIIGIAVSTLAYLPSWIQTPFAFSWTVAMLLILVFPNIVEVVILFSS